MKKLIKFLSMSKDDKKYYLFKLLNKYKLLTSAKITINNVKTTVPIIDGVGLENIFSNETWMTGMISNLCKQKVGAFIDIGVNLGQTLIKYKSQQIDQPYFGFEPNPNCYAYAKELIRKNHYTNSEIFPVGLSDKNDIASLFINSLTDSSGSIIKDFRNHDQYSMQLRVLTMKADDILPKLIVDSISVIKIDVEGAELEVMKGLANVISAYRPFIICEILPVYDENTENGRFRKMRQVEIESILKTNKYFIYRVLSENYVKKLSQIDTHAEIAFSNYVFVPEEIGNTFQKTFNTKDN